ncbi:hypothetical protein DU854_17265 [Salmonella enterica subsp. enterica]|nr:hypothetical protein [Salmonella enterica subsp. enterica serovar Typhimurium]EHP3225501.1 GPW/gp25 family protein [Salmonella enterica subsp. enterica serovar Newport]
MFNSLMTRLSDDLPSQAEDNNSEKVSYEEELLYELKMLLTSRSRIPEIENINLVNCSILNYGINESFSDIGEINSRRPALEQRLHDAIARFEPRLSKVSVTSAIISNDKIIFTINAFYLNYPIVVALEWEDCTGRFYFNE